MKYLGVDIGGTFTDFVIVDGDTGECDHLKVLSTPASPADAVTGAFARGDITPGEIGFFVHGSTVAINALLERKGAVTGIITTHGFRDIFELRRCARTHICDPQMQKPWMFVPRHLRLGVPERILYDGSVELPLDEQAALEAVGRLVDQGVTSIAVCFLNSYANPSHELQLAELVRARFKGIAVSCSADILMEVGEFERSSTTALNAYVRPAVESYLRNLSSEVRKYGVPSEISIMQSNGGIMGIDEAGRKPVHIIESGPAGGSIAAAMTGRMAGAENVISFDMGGTTSKSSVIQSGVARQTLEFELFEEAGKPGSGWPLKVPMIEIVEIGTGGGSIAWVDETGVLHVGPESAGADPGPACYNRGGVRPTITDANVVLGRLASLTGGDFALSVQRAYDAVDTVAKRLKCSVVEAAAGIITIADNRASNLIHEVTVSRGIDPRDFSLIAFGGAGPLHAAGIASDLGLQQAIIPPQAGTFSALGMLVADVVHDVCQPQLLKLPDVTAATTRDCFAVLVEKLRSTLKREGIPATGTHYTRSADLRYEGQNFSLQIDWPQDGSFEEQLTALAEAFHKTHKAQFLYEARDNRIELVNFRARVVGRCARPNLKELQPHSTTVRPGHRDMFVAETRRFASTPVYWRPDLGAGFEIAGPALVEEYTSTTYIPPAAIATVDRYANLVIR